MVSLSGDQDTHATTIPTQGAIQGLIMQTSISVVVPVYNGAKTIKALVNDLKKALSGLFDLEIVLVNDGSSDNSAKVCLDISEKDTKIKFVSLSRNFGEHNAVMAGLNFCTGDVAVIIDDDFQNPPSEIIKLIHEIDKGYDIVYSYYDKKEHNFMRNLGSKFNNIVATILIGKPRKLYLSSFKAISRFVINELIKHTDPYPYIDGIILRITRHYSTVLVQHNSRQAGKSNYTIHKLLSLWLNMFTNFSILPLRITTVTGFLFAIIGFAGAVFFLIEKIQNPDLPVGWASIIISLFVISGVQLMGLGMIGEYLGRMFMSNNGKPQFVVRKAVNCGEKENAKFFDK